MNNSRFDGIAKHFANRRISRRQVLAQGGAGVAAGALAATGLSSATAQDATPTTAPDASHGPTMLFLQSFQSGSIAPKDGADGTYTLTLEHGLGQTIYFSDRPDRIVGATPTPKFLKALGFQPDNPPNAALVVQAAADDTDIAVLELLNPRYDEASHTATYDVTLLKDWERTLDVGFAEQPTDLAQLHPQFGAAHLFIDDCPDSDMNCIDYSVGEVYGTIPNSDHNGYCWSGDQGACLPCTPWYEDFYEDKDNSGAIPYWNDQCNQRFSKCNGNCTAFPICTQGFSDECE
jgi:hypothetical protein